MDAGAAPLYDDIADAPAGGIALWRTCADGVRVRVALWPLDGAKGTVLLFPGRTEYVEKYGPAAGELAARGYAMACIDWRGQGLADRPLADPARGHVGRFAEYQLDVAQLVAAAHAAGLPEPFHLIAHSMGGSIGLRALHEGLPVRSAVFSAPMWGIKIHAAARPLAWAIGTGARMARRGHLYAPSTGPVTYVLANDAPGNVLTTDPAMYAFMQRQLRAHPELALGGPTLHWLLEALRETRALAALPAPALPCLCIMGGNERVVDTGRIRSVMARWAGGQLELIPGAEHEIMMETPAARQRFYDRAAALFDAER